MADLSFNNNNNNNSNAVPNYLNDLFGDCFFTPEGEAVFLSEEADRNNIVSSSEATPATVASRIMEDGSAVPAIAAGGIAATNLDKPGLHATVMGPSAVATTTTTAAVATQQPASVPFMQPPQKDNHIGFATLPTAVGRGGAPGTGKSRRTRKMSEQQQNERRERNREHAKRSRIRKKFLLESLQQSVQLLKEENEKLKDSIKTHLGEDTASKLLAPEHLQSMSSSLASSSSAAASGAGVVTSQVNLAAAAGKEGGIIANTTSDANKVLDDPDFNFIKALQTAQQNFVVTDPSLPDNPIVYATQGFLNLTGYTLDQVLGRNCRFLQGPETDPKAVDKIRKAIEAGIDMSVCLLNYRADGTTFWNQFFIAALRDAAGNVTNYVGVQCKVSDQYAATVCKRQSEIDDDDNDADQDVDDDL